ncbi:hypothetical protein BG011_005430 [Mortierella polycephala]|uniref:Uncharacterized protein n=1 Tax=Mortierella polycephala TaxID=41804 RepID=A0A9P6PYN1_9FUNG|nr:hypothetical protein BG011_005430 [Mortierella polycephala]
MAAVEEGLAMPNPKATWTTTIERQHWLLTDMNFFLYHTICTFHLIVPFIYWGFLAYSGEAKMMAVDVSVVSLWLNYSFHGGDLIIVLLEIAINTMPFIPSHFVVVFFVCLLYLAETHVVYYVDGFWIYPFLDTTGGPIWVLLYFGVGCAILVAFTFMYYLHRIRNACHAKYHRRSIVDSSMLQQQQVQQPSQQIFLPPSHPLESTDTDISRPGHDSAFTIRQFTRLIQTKVQNRKRSCSNSSQESTASTLVGSDDPILSKTKGIPCINGSSPVHSDETLEVVDALENDTRVLDQENDSTQA